MTCRICGSDHFDTLDSGVQDFEYGAPGSYAYHRCLECDSAVIDPVPDDHVLALAYPKNYHAYLPHRSLLARRLKTSYWKSKARAVARLAGPDGSVLDVGCGRGDLLQALRDLGQTRGAGVEFSPGAISVARERGLTVYQGELGDVPLPPGSQDVVVMVNFIEHVRDPVSVLRDTARLLKPGGYLVGETPAHDAWDRRLFGRHWGGYHAPRHLFIFSEESLGRLAREVGLRVEAVRNLLQPAHWALGVQNMLSDSGHVSLRNGRSALFPLLLLAFAPINLGERILGRTSLVEFVLKRP